jgi:TPR repeat protein
MCHLGKLLSSRHHAVPLDLPAVRAWLAKAAAYGDAMYQLGWFMQYELEPPDEAIAHEWFRNAAAAGDIRAQNENT